MRLDEDRRAQKLGIHQLDIKRHMMVQTERGGEKVDAQGKLVRDG